MSDTTGFGFVAAKAVHGLWPTTSEELLFLYKGKSVTPSACDELCSVQALAPFDPLRPCHPNGRCSFQTSFQKEPKKKGPHSVRCGPDFILTEKALGLVSFVVVGEPCRTPIRLEKIRPSPSPSTSPVIRVTSAAASATVPVDAHPGERRLAQ